MTLPRCVLLGIVLLLVALSSVNNVSAARGRSSHHSYPSSRGGLSGHGSHGYPSSGGLSGSGGSHGYPSSGGSHTYPSSGGSHTYPSSGGSHTYPSSGGNHGYPSSGGSHGYPSSGGLSGNNNGRGVSGNTHTSHTTNIYNNYHYNPPKQIMYTPAHGRPMSYPVYHGPPPTYVYQYKDSGSKYGTLLAGLALLNLGTLAGTAYAVSHSGSGSGSSYKTQPGEYCKFGIRKDNGDYEETRIDCQLITSFIFQAEQEKSQNGGTNTSVVTTTVTNVTIVNTTNGAEPAPATPLAGNVTYTMLPNGTLVPVTPINTTNPEPAANGVSSSVAVTTTTTNTTVTNALDVKGKPVDVTPGMKCYVIRHLNGISDMRKTVPCGLLQSYATQSLKKNSAARNMPVFTILTVVAALLVY